MIDEFLNSAQSEYDSLKAHCDFIERENRALTKEIEMCDKKIDKLRATRDKAIDLVEKLIKEYKLNYGDEPSKMLLAYETLLNTLREVE